MTVAVACPDAEKLAKLAAGKTSAAEMERFASHLENCAACAKRMDAVGDPSALVKALRASAANRPAGESRLAPLIARLEKLAAPCAIRAADANTPAPLADMSTHRNHPRATNVDYTYMLAPPQGPDEIGRLDAYRILKVLGAGGMGVVFLAEDTVLKRRVAIKAMKSDLASSSDGRARFLREAQMMATVKHQNVVAIYHAAEHNRVAFLVMEYLSGETLESRLKREGRLPIAEALRICREVAEGLAAAHAVGLIHRDIKPANLWLEKDQNHVRILDFGLARAIEVKNRITQSGAVLGTPAYMAPEQATAKAVDAAADLFSLGIVLYRMTTAKLPFTGPDVVQVLLAIGMKQPDHPRLVNPEIPEDVSELIMRLLEKKPEDRPASAAKLVIRLKHLERAHRPQPARPETSDATTAAFKPDQVKETPKAPSEQIRPKPTPKPPMGKSPRRVKPMLLAAAAVGVVFLGLLITCVAGIILRVESKDGTLIIKSDDPNAVVKVTPEGGATLTYGKDRREIQLKPGKYGIELADAKSGLKLSMTQFTLTADGKKTIEISWEKKFDAPGKVAAALQPKDLGLPKAVTVDLGGGVKMEFVLIPKGKFQMGSPATEPGRAPWEKDFDSERQHEVEISKPFYLAKYPVTQQQYQALMKKNPSYFQAGKTNLVQGLDTKQFPVESVFWDDAQAFCKKMLDNDNQKRKFRLPTEAEWEYACRAGSQTAFFFGDDRKNLGDYAWFRDNSGGRTHQVGEKNKPNAWGLCDMHGNVCQWCEDYYGPYDDDLKYTDPLRSAKYDNNHRVWRGSFCNDDAWICRTAFRYCFRAPQNEWKRVGFRVAIVIPDEAGQVPSADPDRTAAEYVLSMGGVVRVNDEERDIRAVAGLPPKSFRLTWFSLRDNNRVNDAGLANFKGCENLTNLDVWGTNVQVTDKGLAYFKDCKKLKVLALRGTQTSDVGLALFKDCKDMKEIYLCRTRVTDEGLAHLKDCKDLMKLSLVFTQVGDTGLASIKDCKSLTHLSLGGTRVSNAGLANFKDCKNLKVLDLFNTKVSDAGLAHFKDCKNLTQLFLASTQMSDKGLAYFKGSENLEILEQRGSKVTKAGLDDFRKALPKCKIDAAPDQ